PGRPCGVGVRVGADVGVQLPAYPALSGDDDIRRRLRSVGPRALFFRHAFATPSRCAAAILIFVRRAASPLFWGRPERAPGAGDRPVLPCWQCMACGRVYVAAGYLGTSATLGFPGPGMCPLCADAVFAAERDRPVAAGRYALAAE